MQSRLIAGVSPIGAKPTPKFTRDGSIDALMFIIRTAKKHDYMARNVIVYETITIRNRLAE